jgi:predicted nucleic acid-binding protein
MATLIDSSVLIAIERERVALTTVLAEHGEEEVVIAAITASELLHGVHRAKSAKQRTRREAFVEQLLTALTVIPFDMVVARVHARLWADLATKGINIGAHDLLIAATALATGAPVATRDDRSFPRIPGLTVVRW